MLATKNPASHALALLLIGAAAAILAGCMASGPRALLDGESAIDKGKYAAAIPKLQRAVELLPGEPRAWNLLGLAYHRSGQPQLAAEAYRRALANDRSNLVTVAHFNLGCLLLEQGSAAAAAEELRSFTMISNTAPAWVKLGQAQLRMRQFDAAERSFANALHVQRTNAEAYNNLGVLYLQRGRARDAATYLNAALQINPKYAPALLNTAVLSQQNPATRATALQRYKEYLALQPKGANSERVSAVVRQLEAELAPKPAVPVPATNPPQPFAREGGNTNKPIVPAPSSNAPSAVTALSSNPPARTALTTAPPARSLSPSELAAQREAALKSVAESRATTAAPARAAVANTMTNPPRPAVTSAPPAVTVVPVAPPVKIASAGPVSATNVRATPLPAEPVAPKTNVFAKAPDAARAAAADEPPAGSETKPGFFNRLNPFRSKPDRGTAVETGAVVVAAAPRNATASSSSGAKTFPRYVYANPRPPAAGKRADAERPFQNGYKAQKAGNNMEALLDYQLAISADPSYVDAQYNQALVTMQAVDAAKSLPMWETVLALEPDSVNARYNFALALKQSGFPQDAAAELEKVIEAKPGEARAHLSLANLYAQQLGNTAKAREHYLKLLELDPRNPQAAAIRFWLAANS